MKISQNLRSKFHLKKNINHREIFGLFLLIKKNIVEIEFVYNFIQKIHLKTKILKKSRYLKIKEAFFLKIGNLF